MESDRAIVSLSALAQDHRLALFMLLVEAGPAGMTAGLIAEALELPNSSLSFHLAQLHRAGLIARQRQSRSLVYRADFAAINALVAYLTQNCCGGEPCE